MKVLSAQKNPDEQTRSNLLKNVTNSTFFRDDQCTKVHFFSQCIIHGRLGVECMAFWVRALQNGGEKNLQLKSKPRTLQLTLPSSEEEEEGKKTVEENSFRSKVQKL
jgi:hypothetical protein